MMRVTIWQQFSSNHSASFTVVGVFKSPEDAQKAAGEIRGILDEIAKWHSKNPEARKVLFEGEFERVRIPATPAEVEIGKRYGTEWKYMVEWFQDRHEIVSTYENMVLVQHHHTDNPGRPFDGIMAKLAEKTFFDSEVAEPVAIIRIDLECTAPDEIIAKRLYSEHFKLYDCQVEQAGKQLIFRNCPPDELDFPFIIEWLQQRGCFDFKYTFHQK